MATRSASAPSRRPIASPLSQALSLIVGRLLLCGQRVAPGAQIPWGKTRQAAGGCKFATFQKTPGPAMVAPIGNDNVVRVVDNSWVAQCLGKLDERNTL